MLITQQIKLKLFYLFSSLSQIFASWFGFYCRLCWRDFPVELKMSLLLLCVSVIREMEKIILPAYRIVN